MSYSIKESRFPISSKNTSPIARNTALHQCWWVFLFVVICFGLYFHAAYKKKETIQTLDAYLQNLRVEKQSLLEEREELLLNINSQSDPAWIELTLMKGLGLVPEGKVKVYFDTAID